MGRNKVFQKSGLVRVNGCEGLRDPGGYMTIELALLMPFILFIIWNLIFLSFYMYDHSTGLQGCYVTALRTERWLGDMGEKQSEAEKKYSEALSSKMACAADSINMSITDSGISVGTTITMNAPGSPFFLSRWEGSHELKADDWRPVRFIRNIRKAEKLKDIVTDHTEGP